MRILVAGKQHYDPGGIPASNDQLAHRVVLAGHHVAVLAHRAFDAPPPPLAQRNDVLPEPGRGYEAYSIDLLPPGAGLEIVVRWFRPDVLVVNAGGAWWHDWTRALVYAAPRDLPVVLYVRDRGAIELLDELASRTNLVLVNAHDHAESAARHGVDAVVVPSVIDAERYRTEPTGEAVVFINPTASKGVETAFLLAARRPDVVFHFRESWHLPARVARDVAERAANLGNVEFLPSSTDPVEAYRRARLLLAPYEDFNRPRVVPEAQVSGIPVLARDDPALREAVGPGGILVPAQASINAWLDGLRTLWDDEQAHARYAAAALQHSRRPELDADDVAARFVAALVDATDRHRLTAASARPPILRSISNPDSPLASVVVPVRNVAATIDEQLAALAAQSYRGRWEVVVADNGSTDATRSCVEAWQRRLPALRIVDASDRRGVARARNVGLRAATGDVLLICDGDDVVAPDWLERMVAALDDHPIVTGRIDVATMNPPEQYEWMGDATMTSAPVAYGYLPYAPGGNIGMWRDVFDVLAGFDEELLRAEDIDFGWRASYLGIPVHFEPRAVLHRRLGRSPRSELRSAIRGGVAEAGLYRRHRSHGMPRADGAAVLEQYRWLFRTFPDVVTGRADQYRWAHHAGKRIGRIVGSIRYRTKYL
jgi:glycosyltransferase involved in cell wall biosynthesis